MAEREFQNMFTFCCGFEAAALKIPNMESDDAGSAKKQIVIDLLMLRLALQSLDQWKKRCKRGTS